MVLIYSIFIALSRFKCNLIQKPVFNKLYPQQIPYSAHSFLICSAVLEQVKFFLLEMQTDTPVPSDSLSSAPGKPQNVSKRNNLRLPEAFALSHVFDLSARLTTKQLCHALMYLYKVSFMIPTSKYQFTPVSSKLNHLITSV